MTDKTPKRPIPSNSGYSPINLPESPASASLHKNLTGLPRVVRDLIADIYNNIQKWNDYHIRGAHIIKHIVGIKAGNPKGLSIDLEESINDLFVVVQNLRTIKDNLLLFSTQMEALVKLNQQSRPLFISHSTRSLLELIDDIVKAYKVEFMMRELILENLAHCNNVNHAMLNGTIWTYQHAITDRINLKLEILLMESGHRKFN